MFYILHSSIFVLEEENTFQLIEKVPCDILPIIAIIFTIVESS